MDDLVEEMMDEGYSADEIEKVTDYDQEDLAEKYLQNGYSIKETADELNMDEADLEQFRDEYDDE